MVTAMSSKESNILIAQPVSITVYTAIACLFSLIICLMFYFGQYAQKQRVTGILVPDKGLLKVYSPEPATVITLHVKEGDVIEKGGLLYTLSSTRVGLLKEDNRLEIRDRLEYQLELLADEEKRQYTSNAIVDETANKKINELNKELDIARKTLLLTEKQIEIANANLESYEQLAEKGLYSKIQVKEKKIEVLNYQAQLAGVERQVIDLNARVEGGKQDLALSLQDGKRKLSEIQRNKDTILQRLLGVDYERDIQVTAPVAGTVTGIAIMPGQQTSSATPLLSILPSGSLLQAHLFAPSNAISFIKPGSKVLLRYRAFPYQKFGQHEGTIEYVSRAAVPANEIGGLNDTAAHQNATVYRITVSLPQQYMLAYGNKETLQAGMELDAYISLGMRRIYEWIFEPLFSITG